MCYGVILQIIKIAVIITIAEISLIIQAIAAIIRSCRWGSGQFRGRGYECVPGGV